MIKIMLIAGCSHAAGSEIDGTGDSEYNREHSFGNIVAKAQGYDPINIASGAATNPTIARNVIEWISKHYNPATMDLRVMVAWTESTRVEAPSDRLINHDRIHAAWAPTSDKDFLRVNLGYPGYHDDEKILVKQYQKFVSTNLTYFEITTANLILQIEYYLKMHQLNYIMCSTMPLFTDSIHIKHYTSKIDASRYLDIGLDDQAFFWKYRNAGYVNPKAKYWHHDEVPHQLFAEELLKKWTY
jgi:hypothetical protein